MSLHCKHLLDLPQEILVIIAELVDADARKHLRRVCRTLKEVVDNPIVWRHRCLRLHVDGQRKAPRHLLKVLGERKLTALALTNCHNIPSKKLSSLISHCASLRYLQCSCCVAKFFATKHHDCLPNITSLHIDSELCKTKAKGSCITDLSQFAQLRKLYVDATLYYEESVSSIIRHVSDLQCLEELAMRISKVPPDTQWDQWKLASFNAHCFPQLRALKLQGLPVTKHVFMDDDKEVRAIQLHSLDVGQISELEDWIECVKSVRKLRLELRPQDVNPALLLIKEHLVHVTELIVQADGLGVYPVEFENLPLTLDAFSLHWTVGGMVRKERGILALIPAELRQRLVSLHLPQIRLTEHDIVSLPKQFSQLQHLSCSLADSVSEDHLSELTNHPCLRNISLWFNLVDKFQAAAERIEESTERRLLIRFDTSMSRLHQMHKWL